MRHAYIYTCIHLSIWRTQRLDSKINSIKLRQTENDILIVSNNDYLNKDVDEVLAEEEEGARKLCQCKYGKTAVELLVITKGGW